MKYVAIFHANLNYAFLISDNYERVIRASYEVILDTFREKCPDARYVFEASGYTIDQIARLTPDVLEKLKAAIDSGQCEFMGAPYSHPIMANIPEEDGYWSCELAMRSYEKHLGFRPESFWNPEMTWMQYVPRAFRRAGVKKLVLDFESYMNCNDKDYHWVEKNWAHDMGWAGLHPFYPLDPNCPFLHRPFKDIVPGLDGLARSMRIVNCYIRYFRRGMPLEEFVESVEHWSGDRSRDGATIFIADDAEYVGTTGYYYIKYHDDYSKTFDVDPTAADKLERVVGEVLKLGPMITFSEACETIPPVDEPYFVEDRFAWNRTYADAWAGTPEARRWEPELQMMRKEYKEKYQPIVEAPENAAKYRDLVDRFWLHMTNSANSDGRWPPPPRVTCGWNREWVGNEIRQTRQVLAELEERTRGIPLPPQPEPQAPAEDWRYGFHFTDKDPEDVRNLNNYELGHAVFYANTMVDCGDLKWQEKGKALLRKIFDEFDRRGAEGIRHPAIRDE
jgi:hypothetical protein